MAYGITRAQGHQTIFGWKTSLHRARGHRTLQFEAKAAVQARRAFALFICLVLIGRIEFDFSAALAECPDPCAAEIVAFLI